MPTAPPPTRPPIDVIGSFLHHCAENPRRAIVGSLAFATVVAAADMAVGDAFPLIVCYLPSVLVTCWVGHLAIGTVLAGVCSLGWLVDDVIGLGGEELFARECWTAVAHGCFFLVVIGMLARLKTAHGNERRLARTDALTGLLNAKAFRERAEEEIARSTRTGQAVSVAFIDCDNFKTVNDTLGHLAGDHLLSTIAEQMNASVRAIDVSARMGGDEFAILLPETNRDEADRVVQRLREDLGRRMREHNWPVTFSIGVAIYATPPESVDAMIHGADELMYEVKTGQKDAVVLKLVA